MRSIERNQIPTYAFVFTKYCPYCGAKFSATRKDTRYCSSKCHRDYHSFLQRNPRAIYLKNYEIPFATEWRLRAAEKIISFLNFPEMCELEFLEDNFSNLILLECLCICEYEPLIKRNTEFPAHALFEIVDPQFLPEEFIEKY